MARVKRGVTAHAKHKKVYKAAKGYYGRRKNTIRVAKQAVEKANQYAFRDRKRRKRTFRALWIQRLNAAVRPFGLNYSKFIDGLAKAGLVVDRKVLSDLAIHEPAAFQAIVEKAKAALPAKAKRRRLALCVIPPAQAGHTVTSGAYRSRRVVLWITSSPMIHVPRCRLRPGSKPGVTRSPCPTSPSSGRNPRPSPPPRTRRRWKPCAYRRSARAARCRRS